MKLTRYYLFILVVLGLVLGACAQGPSAGGGGGVPAADQQGAPMARSQGEADFLDGTFDFSMVANLKYFDLSSLTGGAGENIYPGTMLTTWKGEFSVDPAGGINGAGTVMADAVYFNVDEDWCGYGFPQLSDYAYQIKGKVNKEGEKYLVTLKIWELELLTKESDLAYGPGEPTCDDPDSIYSQPVPIFFEQHRTNMIGFIIQKLHTNLENQIVLGIPFSTEIDDVEYEIWVSPQAVE